MSVSVYTRNYLELSDKEIFRPFLLQRYEMIKSDIITNKSCNKFLLIIKIITAHCDFVFVYFTKNKGNECNELQIIYG